MEWHGRSSLALSINNFPGFAQKFSFLFFWFSKELASIKFITTHIIAVEAPPDRTLPDRFRRRVCQGRDYDSTVISYERRVTLIGNTIGVIIVSYLVSKS